MSYKMEDNTTRIISETNQKESLAIRFMLDGVHKNATPNTPKKTGDLRRNVTKEVRGTRGRIKWEQNYAAPQEAGVITIRKSGGVVPPGTYVFRNYTTPGTGKRFARNAIEKVVRDYRQYFRKAGL